MKFVDRSFFHRHLPALVFFLGPLAWAQPQDAPAPSAAAAPANVFNPAISLILSGLYGHTRQDPGQYRISGFPLPQDTLEEIAPQRGFNLGESELVLSASIDQLFTGRLTAALAPDNTVGVEEGFFQTQGLDHGLTLKAGRFLSSIGYLNDQHSHTWDFVDAPLAYGALLGGQFRNDGVQLRWLVPTDWFFEWGAETGRGANYPGTETSRNGAGASAIFTHIGGDIGDSHSWRAGVSWLTASAKERTWSDIDDSGQEVSNSFSGKSQVWVADFIWKWAPQGNARTTNFKVQGEYLRRRESGEVLHNSQTPGDYAAVQDGWYLQGVYQFWPRWRIGLRTERLATRSVDYGANDGALPRLDYAPTRHSLMFDYSPSEYSRFRLQWARDRSQQSAPDNMLYVQYQMSLGAHGAHAF